MEDDYVVSYPGGDFNYSDGRFTNSSDTDPVLPPMPARGTSNSRAISWDLALRPTVSMAESITPLAARPVPMEQRDVTVVDNLFPWGGGDFSLTVDNLGKQVDDYLANNTPDPGALYVIWGGSNDLFNDDSSDNVSAAAANVAGPRPTTR